jgi:hypothetical protein
MTAPYQQWPPYAPAPYVYQALGYQQLIGSGLMTLTVPPNATMALIEVEGQAIRWRDDGTAPTAAIGMPVAVGQEWQYSGPLAALQLIAQSGTATVNISYYR